MLAIVICVQKSCIITRIAHSPGCCMFFLFVFVVCGIRKRFKKNLKLEQANIDNVNKKMLHDLFSTDN